MSRSAQTIAAVLLAVSTSTPARADDPAPAIPAGPFNNEYAIDVTLDAEAMTIRGEARVVFRNFGTRPVSTLPFHLYPNAWSNTGTLWIRDARGDKGLVKRGEAGAGYLRIDSVKLADGADLQSSTETVLAYDAPMMRQ